MRMKVFAVKSIVATIIVSMSGVIAFGVIGYAQAVCALNSNRGKFELGRCDMLGVTVIETSDSSMKIERNQLRVGDSTTRARMLANYARRIKHHKTNGARGDV